MSPVRMVLILLAFVCFALAACEYKILPKGNLMAAGLAFWAISMLIQ